jgi:hypothetical protein
MGDIMLLTLFAHTAHALLFAGALTGSAAPAAAGQCNDPLPIDPAVVTREMMLQAYAGASQMGPACHLRWEGGSGPTLMVYSPTPMADLGQTFTSTREAADRYAGESPKGVEPLPGVSGGYMVFDPSTPIRRIFVKFQKKVYMIVSQDAVPVAVLAKAVIQK